MLQIKWKKNGDDFFRQGQNALWIKFPIWITKSTICRFAKGQLISEWIYQIIVSPKIRSKNCQDFCFHYTGQNSWQFFSVFWEKRWLHKFILKKLTFSLREFNLVAINILNFFRNCAIVKSEITVNSFILMIVWFVTNYPLFYKIGVLLIIFGYFFKFLLKVVSIFMPSMFHRYKLSLYYNGVFKTTTSPTQWWKFLILCTLLICFCDSLWPYGTISFQDNVQVKGPFNNYVRT